MSLARTQRVWAAVFLAPGVGWIALFVLVSKNS